jgi:hypothetical protein
MRRGVGFSWVIGGLLLGCSGGGAAESTGGTTSGSSGATGTGAVGTSTSDVAPTTGAAETGVGATDVDCPAPLERCEGACVDVLHDPQYCGGCGLGCPKELVCVEGQCGVVCGLTATACGPVCSVLSSDPEHCGSCEHACAPGVACIGGSCVPDCAAGEQVCGEHCVNTGNDEVNCGGCDVACPEGQPCVYGACVAADLHHLLISGQSLSCGATSPVVSSEQIYGNLSFNTGVRAGGVGLTSFIALVETWDGSQGETIASGLANMLSEQAQQNGESHVTLASAHGVGGQPYSALKKGTAPYANGMAQVTAAVAIAAMNGQKHAVRALAIVHGESDHVANNLGYTDDLLAWQSDYEADVAVITGATGPLPMFLCQMSSFTKYGSATSRIPAAQLRAAKARPERVFVVGPKYFMPYTDGVHLTGDGERWLGEYYAKAYRKVLIDGERWSPVQPESVVREGAVITIRFAVPAPPLVFDELLVSNPGNYGFEFSDASGAPPAITEVALVDDVTVRVTLASAPVGGNRRIRYAHTGVAGQPAGPTTGARGNLRDSDGAASLHGYLLYNWAVHFDEPVE